MLTAVCFRGAVLDFAAATLCEVEGAMDMGAG